MNNPAKTSFIIAIIPVIVWVTGFLFCFAFSVCYALLEGGTDGGAIFWLFIILLWITVPIALITNIVSIVLAVKGLKNHNKSMLAWISIGVVLLEYAGIIILLFT